MALFAGLILAGNVGGGAGQLSAQTVTLGGGFIGSTLDSGWTVGGSGYTPVLTASSAGGKIDSSGHGWLRLTSAGASQATYAYNTTSFVGKNATITASFNYVSYGGSGADGITFFLADASKTFAVGAYGGSLGYAQKIKAEGGEANISGMNGGYIGLGIDEYGNYANPTEGRTGGTGPTPDAVSVRGPGDGLTGYDYLGGTGTLPTSLDSSGSSRPTTTTFKVIITATNQLTVYADFGGTGTFSALYSIDISDHARPDELIMGFTGSTGGLTNIHEVQDVKLSSVVANLWTNANGDSQWGTDNDWYGSPSGRVPKNFADVLLDNTYVNTAQTINVASNRIIRSLQIDAPFGYTLSNGTLTFNDGGIAGPAGVFVSQTHGSATQTINSALALNQNIEIQNNSAGSLVLGGNVANGGHHIDLNGTGNTALSGIISGGGAITQSGPGTATLSGASTYTGGTTINAGRLNANHATALGTGAVALNGGTLGSTNHSTIANTIALNASAGLSGITSAGTFTQTGGSYTLNMAEATQSGALNLSDNGIARTLTVQVDSGSSTISGAIAGSASNPTLGSGLTKTGAGTLVLSGANTYTGTTTINTGRLNANHATALGTGAVALNGGTLGSSNHSTIANTIALNASAGLSGITSAGTLTQTGGSYTLKMDEATQSGAVNLSNNNTGRTLTAQVDTGLSTISGVIANGGNGAGGLTKTGAGTLMLSGANTYTGTTTISGGTVQLGANNVLANNSSLNLDGGNLNLNGYSDKVGNLAFSKNASIDFGSSVSNNSLVLGNITSSPTGVLMINNYDGPDSSNWSGSGDFLGTTQKNISSSVLNQIYFSGYGTGSLENTSQTNAGNGLGNAYRIAPKAIDWSKYTWVSNSNGDWDYSTGFWFWTRHPNWSGDATPPNGNNPTDVFVNFGTGTKANVSFNLDSTINALRFDSNASAYTITGSKTLTFQNVGPITYVQQQSAKNQTLSPGSIVIKNNMVFDVTGAGNLTVGSPITESGGPFSLTKAGSGGKLILTQANTYTGGTSIQSGTVQIQNSGALGSGTVTVSDGATLELALDTTPAATPTTSPSNAISLSGTGVNAGGALKNASGTNTVIGVVTLAGNTGIQSDAGTLKLTGGITGSGKNLTLAGAGNIDVSSAITTGTGGVTLDGVGTVTFNGDTANTYTGDTIVNRGTLVLSKSSGDKSVAGNLVVNGGTVNQATTDQIGPSSTVTVNSGSYNLTGAGVTQTIGKLTTAATGTVAIGTSNTLTLGDSGVSNVNGTITGAGSLVTTGTVTLSGSTANTFTGGLRIHDGTVALNKTAGTNATGGGAITVGDSVGSYDTAKLKWTAGHQLADSTAITLNRDGVLDFNGHTEAIGSVSGSGHVMIGTGQLIIGADNSNSTLSGLLTGSAGGVLEKTGTGTLTLSSSSRNGGEIDYGGEFNLNAGTLALDDINLTVDTLRLTGTSVLDFGGSSTLTVGTLIIELTGGETLSITSWEQWVDYFYADVVQNGDGTVIPGYDVRGDAPLNHIVFAGWTGDNTKWQEWNNEVTPVPESSSYGALLISGLVGLVACRRRRA